MSPCLLSCQSARRTNVCHHFEAPRKHNKAASRKAEIDKIFMAIKKCYFHTQ